jgi:hypothetical protein
MDDFYNNITYLDPTQKFSNWKSGIIQPAPKTKIIKKALKESF